MAYSYANVIMGGLTHILQTWVCCKGVVIYFLPANVIKLWFHGLHSAAFWKGLLGWLNILVHFQSKQCELPCQNQWISLFLTTTMVCPPPPQDLDWYATVCFKDEPSCVQCKGTIGCVQFWLSLHTCTLSTRQVHSSCELWYSQYFVFAVKEIFFWINVKYFLYKFLQSEALVKQVCFRIIISRNVYPIIRSKQLGGISYKSRIIC